MSGSGFGLVFRCEHNSQIKTEMQINSHSRPQPVRPTRCVASAKPSRTVRRPKDGRFQSGGVKLPNTAIQQNTGAAGGRGRFLETEDYAENHYPPPLARAGSSVIVVQCKLWAAPEYFDISKGHPKRDPSSPLASFANIAVL